MANCPICGEQDRSARLSAIVRSGTATTTGHGTTQTSGTAAIPAPTSFLGPSAHHATVDSVSHHSFHATHTTRLAEQLQFPYVRPPSQAAPTIGLLALFLPILVTVEPALVWIGAFLLFFAWLWSVTDLPSGVVILLFLFAVGFSVLILGFLLSLPVDSEAVKVLLTALLCVACVASGAALVVSGRREQRHYVQVVRPAQERAWAVWSRLHYCFRDDALFDPATGAVGSVRALPALLAQGGQGLLPPR